MKTSSCLAVIRSVALGLAVFVGISAHAATTSKEAVIVPAGKKKAVAVARASSNPNEIGLLDQAYGLLRRADHDYKGHRAHAMHAIEVAARELGGKLGGGGKGDEAQKTSDSQLESARSLLQKAVGGLTGKPLHHVQVAIQQLGIALSIK
jgi:hypothetical protein